MPSKDGIILLLSQCERESKQTFQEASLGFLHAVENSIVLLCDYFNAKW